MASKPIDKCIEPSGTNQCLLNGIGIGDGVVIQGLVKRPELNSQSGVVKALSQELGRVVVELDEGDGGAPAAVKVKPSNVEVAEEATPLDLASLLLDAQAQALAHPDTFAAPSASALALLPRPGIDLVKVCDGMERFWVLVRSVDGDRVTGRVDNELVGGQAYANHGSVISFEKRHIYRLMVYLEPLEEAWKTARYLGQHEAAQSYFKEQIDGDVPEGLGVPVESVAEVERWFAANPDALAGTGLAVDDVACHHLYPRSKVPNGDSMYYDNLMNLCVSTRVAALALDD